MDERIKETSIALIQKQADFIENLSKHNISSNEKQREEFYSWKHETADILKNIFGKDSDHIKRFNDVDFKSEINSLLFEDTYEYDAISTSAYKAGLVEAKAILLAATKEINNFGIVKHENQENTGGTKIIISQFAQALAQMNVQNTFSALIEIVEKNIPDTKTKEECKNSIKEIEDELKNKSPNISKIREKISKLTSKAQFLKPVFDSVLTEIIKKHFGI